MDPVVAAALVAAVGGFATAVVARRSTQKIDGIKVQLDGWGSLYQTVVAELAREREARRHDVNEERAIGEGFARKAERLERELNQCRQALAGTDQEGLA